jgi:hypothetical protein
MKNVKDINRAIFIAFKKYVFNLFEEESKINKQHKGNFKKISIINISCYNIYKDDFVIELLNPDNLFSRIAIDNRFLKNWFEDLSFFKANIENINPSWDAIIMDTFIEYLNGKVEFH